MLLGRGQIRFISYNPAWVQWNSAALLSASFDVSSSPVPHIHVSFVQWLNSWKLRAIKRAVWAAADPGLVPRLRPPISSTSLRYGSRVAAFDLWARIQGILILPVMSKVVSSIRTTSTLSLNYLFRDRKIRRASSKEGMSTYNGSVVAPKIIVFFLIVWTCSNA